MKFVLKYSIISAFYVNAITKNKQRAESINWKKLSKTASIISCIAVKLKVCEVK